MSPMPPPPATTPDRLAGGRTTPVRLRWRLVRDGSLRFRLLALGLMPLPGVADWDLHPAAAGAPGRLSRVGPTGLFIETVLHRRDGSTHEAEVSLSRAERGERTFVVALMRDISARKAVEAELARYRVDLERQVELHTKELQDRNERLDAIFALSPDGFVNLPRAREMAADRRRDILDTVARPSELMVTIVNQRLDLAARVAESVTDFRPPPGLDVDADRSKMQQAVLNIVANADKYSPQGGDVEVGWRRDVRDGAVRLGVQVRDRGIGMAEEQRAHVGERVYRADASGNIPGTGLGPAIVKEIVELHGGAIEIASTFGEGTQVTLWLPAAPDTSVNDI